jgi:fructokinase
MEPFSKHPVVCFGEVLWDILPSGPLPGGAPMNVAYHLKKLGTDPALITKIGLDGYGEKLVNILAASEVSTEFFFVDYKHPTGLVYANANDHNEVVYDIVFPSAWDFIEWKDELQSLVQDAVYFVFGSLACRNKVSRDTLGRLLDAAKTKVLDINLRPPHYHRTDVEFLLGKADILKMNIAELELITGWFSHFQTIEDRVKLMQDAFHIETLIITMGGDGALIYDQGTFHRHEGFSVTVADTIGSGDAFLAGFLSQVLNGSPVKSALEFASAMGAFIATKSGACPPYEISEITQLMQSGQNQTLHTI